MSLLLDTHTFLWFVQRHPSLVGCVRTRLETTVEPIFVSIASCWEITIKYKLGKLKLSDPPKVYLPNAIRTAAFTQLPITMADLAALDDLPLHHRDPFDRVLAAQSLANGFDIVSCDAKLDQYGVCRIWS
jgi:PIN domain nuclease of toxin-antitoxin system